MVLEVNPATGEVTQASMGKSTGNNILDDASLSAVRHGHLQKGGPRHVQTPIIFTMTGARVQTEYEEESKNMDDVLARSLERLGAEWPDPDIHAPNGILNKGKASTS